MTTLRRETDSGATEGPARPTTAAESEAASDRAALLGTWGERCAPAAAAAAREADQAAAPVSFAAWYKTNAARLKEPPPPRRRYPTEAARIAAAGGSERTPRPLYPSVSVCVPTTVGRRSYHAHLYRCFMEQTMHGDNDDQLEMLIFEDGGPHESEFWKAKAAADGRIQYMHRGSPLNVDTCNANNPSQSSIGEKRNLLASAARGRWIAHFDDDDYYAPNYLEHMLGNGREQSADLIKLVTWPNYVMQYATLPREIQFKFGPQCTPDDKGGAIHMRDQSVNPEGFGFSFLYRRHLAASRPFPAVSFNEDAPWAVAVQRHDRARMALVRIPVDDPITVHIHHGRNSSICDASMACPDAMFAKVQALDLPRRLGIANAYGGGGGFSPAYRPSPGDIAGARRGHGVLAGGGMYQGAVGPALGEAGGLGLGARRMAW